MSCVEVRERSRDSPCRARSLLTVRAAISSARSSEAPCSSWLSFMCSYCRARLVPGLTPRGGMSAARLPALSPGRLLLSAVAAAARAARLAALAAAAAASARALAALLRRRVVRAGVRVRDGGRARLAHALLAQALVLLVVLDARSVVLDHGHLSRPLKMPSSYRSPPPTRQ